MHSLAGMEIPRANRKLTPGLALESKEVESRVISPYMELGAYEALWMEPKASFKSIADKFRERPDAVPSTFVPDVTARKYAVRARDMLTKAGVREFGISVHGTGEYPMKLRAAKHPVELLYYQGWWDLVYSPCVAVVGARTPSEGGIARTKRLVKCLIEDKWTVVSGLARGIDTVAHEATIENGGRTIAVIGTPLNVRYPRENAELQDLIAKQYLVISQVPVCRYQTTLPTANRFFFPERNITMSALTEATIIVEVTDTSGTLVQARHALKQNRKLFILENNFQNASLKWPHRLEKQGAIRVREYDDIRRHLVPPALPAVAAIC